MLDPELLRQFLTVTKYMNFSRAADAMYLSHTTVSRNMTALESSLGVKLFERGKRRITLTPAGTVLASKGAHLLEHISMLEQELRALGRNGNGQITVASFKFYLSEIYHCLHLFQNRYPSYELTICHKDMDEIIPMLRDRTADLGFSLSFALESDMNGFDVLPLARGKFFALVSMEDPIAAQKKIRLADLHNRQMILLGKLDYDFVINIGRGSHLGKPHPKVAESFESLLLQVKAGLGMALVPQHAITEAGGGCVALELDGIESDYEVVLLYLKENENPVLKEMLDIFNGFFSVPDSPPFTFPADIDRFGACF